MKRRRTNVNVDMTTITVLIITAIVSICFYGYKISTERTEKVLTVEDFKYSSIAVEEGSFSEIIAKQNYPKANIVQFAALEEVFNAVESGHVESGVAGIYSVREYNKKRNVYRIVSDSVINTNVAIGFGKTARGEHLLKEFDAYLDRITKDGTLDKMKSDWFSDEPEDKIFDFSKLPLTNGFFSIGIDKDYPPFSYKVDGVQVGYDLEILYSFFEEKGYGGRVHPVNFGNLIPGLENEKYDVICGGVTITEERSKVVNFSKPNMELSYSVFCTAKEAVPYKNLIEFTKDAFHKTFILEDRYLLFLDGVRVTFVITIFAALLGTVLSILICCYRLTGSKIADLLCNMYVSVIEGVPHTVLLMIFYYVVFRNSKLNAVIVAIITMAINFSSYVSEIMITGIRSVDIGQFEAAKSQGFRKIEAYLKFIIPQSLITILPLYKNEIVTLFKSTSIVGYIAIFDMVKVADIIRSRTYEPIIPLVSVSIVYYLFGLIVMKITDKVLNKIDWTKKGEQSLG